MTAPDEPVVELESVSVEFRRGGLLAGLLGDREVVHAVDDVSLAVGSEDVVALVGESGCGKTTLGKAAIGLQRPTAGTVRYRGQDVWAAKDGRGDPEIPYETIRRSLQIVHQDPGSSLNPNRTVLASLVAPLKRWQPHLGTGERRERVLELLEEVGMTPPADYAARYPHQLSGGEKQRAALVRAVLMNPDLILADEAVSALDVSLRVEMMDLMLSLQDAVDTSFLFVSHDLANARYFAERAGGRIGVMYLGELVEVGPAERVIEDPRHPYTRVLHWATPELDPDERVVEDPPVRRIDVPDPVDPPSGCRFHTRCPEARETCVAESPPLVARGGRDGPHRAACFRQYDDHEYWSSPPLEEGSLADE